MYLISIKILKVLLYYFMVLLDIDIKKRMGCCFE